MDAHKVSLIVRDGVSVIVNCVKWVGLSIIICLAWCTVSEQACIYEWLIGSQLCQFSNFAFPVLLRADCILKSAHVGRVVERLTVVFGIQRIVTVCERVHPIIFDESLVIKRTQRPLILQMCT